MENKYVAFISYRHTKRDSAIAKQVHGCIEKYIVPKALRTGKEKTLGKVFRDEEELPISSDLSDDIRKALDASGHLILICSRETKKSIWVQREIEYFLSHHSPEKAFIVLVDGEPGEVFPYALSHLENRETGELTEIEPLAMDVRSKSISGSKKLVKKRIRKLCAGLLGCPYDSLVQREKARRNRRILAVVAGLLCISCCFTAIVADRNRKLSQAYSQSLLDQSRMLTDDAEQALLEGDRFRGMELSMQALQPPGNGERPYYAPAEAALFAALDPFGTGSGETLLRKTALLHNAPIEGALFSEDGKRAYTVDSYGTVRCFSSDTGDILWDHPAMGSERPFLSGVTAHQLFYDEEEKLILCSCSGAVTAFHPQSGSIVWHYEHKSDVDSGMFFDQENHLLAFVTHEYTENSTQNYLFAGISTRTGQEVYALPLLQDVEIGAMRFQSSEDPSLCGSFAGEGSFVGMAYKVDEESCTPLLYAVEENTVRLFFMEPLPNRGDNYHYLGLAPMEQNRALVAYDGALHGKSGLFVQCVDTQTGKILWETAAEKAGQSAENGKLFVHSKKEAIVLASGKCMYVLEKETGNLRSFAGLTDPIAAMFSPEPSVVGYVLSGGRYVLGYENRSGLMDSSVYQLVIQLPEVSGVRPFKGGLLQLSTEDDPARPFAVPPLEKGGGRLLCIAKDKSSAEVISVPERPAIEPRQPTLVNGENGEYADRNDGGYAVIAPLYESGKTYALMVNLKKKTVSVPAETTGSGLSRYYVTGDGRYMIGVGTEGNIQLMGQDGQVEKLSEGEKTVLYSDGETDYITGVYSSDAARLSGSGTIAAARCGKGTIEIWKDGFRTDSIPLPEEIRWKMQLGPSEGKLFKVGQNGLVLLSHYPAQSRGEMESFAVYDLYTRKWKTLPDEARGDCTRTIAFAGEKKLFAVMDSDMLLRIYDFDLGRCILSIHTKLPRSAVEFAAFVQGDESILLGTRDGQICVYDLTEGSRVHQGYVHTPVDKKGYEGYALWEDPENRRLYISAHGHACCWDTRQWVKLFGFGKEDRFLFYDAAEEMIYLQGDGEGMKQFSLCPMPVPSTGELMDLARQITQ